MALKPNFILAFIVLVVNSAWTQDGAKEKRPFLFSLGIQEVQQTDFLDANLDLVKAPSELKPSEFKYWNAAYPSYRWHQVMVEAGKSHKGHKNGGRMAVLHLAIYDALTSSNKIISEAVCKRSIVAGAAYGIIKNYFPEQEQWLDSILGNYRATQFMAKEKDGKAIDYGIKYGLALADKYNAFAKTNNTDKVWTGSVPDDPKLWSGTPYKYGPTKKDWKPITLNAANQFRPVPPPKDWSTDMQELRDFYKKPRSSDIAWKWKSQPIWDLLLERKILEYGLDIMESAYVSAVFHAARYDATIAAWDGKYHYWGIRPFQYDLTFEPILETPNFPGYPAGHTTVAGALAKVLAHFFPHDTEQFEALALECSESRFEGGVHFRTDNEVGLEVGSKVGQHVIETFEQRTSAAKP